MRKLYRNIAFVTSVFILALTAMLCVSYYQMQQVSPLETGVMETLKELNESNGDNELLGQQIRELDLLSRKAYFVKEGQLKMGLYLLLGMALVLIVSLNLYYKETKTLPEKDFDPIDDWMTKSRARWQNVDLTAKPSGTVAEGAESLEAGARQLEQGAAGARQGEPGAGDARDDEPGAGDGDSCWRQGAKRRGRIASPCWRERRTRRRLRLRQTACLSSRSHRKHSVATTPAAHLRRAASPRRGT